MRRLTGNVAKRDPRTGQVRVFLAGSEVPDDPADWFAQQDNYVQAAVDAANARMETHPPRAGAGSSTEAWRAYADGRVDVTDDMGRDEIIAALAAAGHIDKQ